MGDPEDDDVFVDALTLSPEIAEILDRHKARAPAIPLFGSVDRSKSPRGLSRWGAQLTIRRGPYIIDPLTAVATPVVVPGLDRVLGVAGEAVRHAIGVADGELRLLRESDGDWQPMALPPAALISPASPISLWANGDALAIRSGPVMRRRLDWWTGDRWLATPYSSSALLVSSQRLWLARANGAWGGSLHGLSVPSTGSEPVFDTAIGTALPVRALAWGPGQVPFVGAGISGFGLAEMYIGSLAADATLRPHFVSGTLGAAMALARGRGDPPTAPDAAQLRQHYLEARAWLPTFRPCWPHDDGTLLSIDVGRHGELCMLTSAHGIFGVPGGVSDGIPGGISDGISGGDLVALTPGWPRDLVLDDGALAVVGDRAVIASDRLGVLVCELGVYALPRRVQLP